MSFASTRTKNRAGKFGTVHPYVDGDPRDITNQTIAEFLEQFMEQEIRISDGDPLDRRSVIFTANLAAKDKDNSNKVKAIELENIKIEQPNPDQTKTPSVQLSELLKDDFSFEQSDNTGILKILSSKNRYRIGLATIPLIVPQNPQQTQKAGREARAAARAATADARAAEQAAQAAAEQAAQAAAAQAAQAAAAQAAQAEAERAKRAAAEQAERAEAERAAAQAAAERAAAQAAAERAAEQDRSGGPEAGTLPPPPPSSPNPPLTFQPQYSSSVLIEQARGVGLEAGLPPPPAPPPPRPPPPPSPSQPPVQPRNAKNFWLKPIEALSGLKALGRPYKTTADPNSDDINPLTHKGVDEVENHDFHDAQSEVDLEQTSLPRRNVTPTAKLIDQYKSLPGSIRKAPPLTGAQRAGLLSHFRVLVSVK
jgi:hypothetical protein